MSVASSRLDDCSRERVIIDFARNVDVTRPMRVTWQAWWRAGARYQNRNYT